MCTSSQQNLDTAAFYKWSKILIYLENHFGEATIAAWFEGAVLVEFTDKVLKFRVGNAFQCDIINRRCLHHIQNALKELFNSTAAVEVFVSIP